MLAASEPAAPGMPDKPFSHPAVTSKALQAPAVLLGFSDSLS